MKKNFRLTRHAALRRAKLRQVRFHDLRHSFASNLLGSGTDIVTVSEALGHANVHITLTTYAHPIPRERQGAGDALARLMGQSGNKMEPWTQKLGIMVKHNQAQVIDSDDNDGRAVECTGLENRPMNCRRLSLPGV
jgi:hypothetical protein